MWKCGLSASEEPKRWMAVTAPLRPCGAATALRYHRSMWSSATDRTPRSSSGLRASSQRRRKGSVRTHCRVPTWGTTRSTSDAARSAMRRPQHAGQNPRPLHENGTRTLCAQSPHWSQAKPLSAWPQARKFSTSRSAARGRNRSWADRSARRRGSPTLTARWSRSSLEPRSSKAMPPREATPVPAESRRWSVPRRCRPTPSADRSAHVAGPNARRWVDPRGRSTHCGFPRNPTPVCSRRRDRRARSSSPHGCRLGVRRRPTTSNPCRTTLGGGARSDTPRTGARPRPSGTGSAQPRRRRPRHRNGQRGWSTPAPGCTWVCFRVGQVSHTSTGGQPYHQPGTAGTTYRRPQAA